MTTEEMRKAKIADLAIVLTLFALNVIIKSVFLGTHTLDTDEPYTLYHAQESLGDLFSVLQRDNNPPLFFIILHFWIKVFGISETSARFLPMLFSSTAVIFIYLIGRKYYGIVVASGACLLYSLSNLNIMESHDTRAYTLFVLLSTLSIYFYLRVSESEDIKKPAIALTVINTLLIYTHLLGFFILLIEVIYTLAIPSIRKRFFQLHLKSTIVCGLFYLPYFIFIALSRILDQFQTGMPFEKARPYHLFQIVWAFSNYNIQALKAFLVVLTLFFILLIIRKKIPERHDIIIWGWFVLPFSLMYLVSYKMPMTIPKYEIFITPAFFLMISVAANDLVRKFRVAGVTIIFILAYLMYDSIDLKASNYAGSKDVVASLIQHKRDSTGVFLIPPWVVHTFSYYYDRETFSDYKNLTLRLEKQNVFTFWTPDAIDTFNLTKLSSALLLDGVSNGSTFFDPTEKIYTKLKTSYQDIDTVAAINGYVIYRFQLPVSRNDTIQQNTKNE